MPDELTIITVSFNSAQAIIDHQDRLYTDSSLKLIIVDNASPDGSADRLAARYPDVPVLVQETNLGYGRGANAGLAACTTPYALLLNPDIIVEKESIQALLGQIKQGGERIAIAGPATSRPMLSPGAPPQLVDWISGCAMLFNLKALDHIGHFDNNIFLYSEETELCFRARQAGYKLMRCDSILFEHAVGGSSGSSPALEYLRWWHFGWSSAYRMTKHNQATLWKNPRRKMLTSRLQSMLASSPGKKLKWRAKADGFAAFLRGEDAFDREGRPMMMDQVFAEQREQ